MVPPKLAVGIGVPSIHGSAAYDWIGDKKPMHYDKTPLVCNCRSK